MVLNSSCKTLSADHNVGVFPSHRIANIKMFNIQTSSRSFLYSFIIKLLPPYFRKHENRESYKEHRSFHFSTNKKYLQIYWCISLYNHTHLHTYIHTYVHKHM